MPIATNPETGDVVYLTSGGTWEPAKTAINPQTKQTVAWDGLEWQDVRAPKGIMGTIDDAVRSVASGVTFGWADEIAAKMDEITGRGGSYNENVQRERARDADIPVTIQLPGEIAGAVGTTVLTAPVAAWRAFAGALSSLPQATRLAGLGAAEGALAGAGNATEGNRAEGAATGAAIGAPIGAVAPTVARTITGTASGVRNAVSVESGAASDIGRAMVRDGVTSDELAARLATIQADRPVATLADVGGENVRGLVERVAQTPGAGRTQVIPALTLRQQEQATRLTGDLQSLTGTQRTARQAIDETMTARAAAARPLYDDAFNFEARAVPEIVDAFESATKNGFGKAALDSGNLKKTLQTEYGIDDVNKAPLMVLIDAWKKEVDDMVGEAVRSGKNNQARVLGTMQKDVLAVVDDFNPQYAQARDAWAGPSRFIDAVEDGRAITSTKFSSEELSAKIRTMTDAELEAFRIGAVSSIVARMGNDPAKFADMTKYLRSPEMREKIVAIMPTTEAAQSWLRRLDYEVVSSEMTGRALGNSATARRLAEQNDAKGIVGDLVTDALSAGGAHSFLRRVVTAGPRWLRDTLRSRTDKEIGEILTDSTRSGDVPAMLSRITQPPPGTTKGATAVTAAGVTAVQP